MNCKEISLDIKTSGKRLKLLEKDTFLLESEQDLDIVMDFALFELLSGARMLQLVPVKTQFNLKYPPTSSADVPVSD